MPAANNYLALDVGEKRIGVAVGDDAVRIAIPFLTVDVDGSEVEAIAEMVINQKVKTIVVGYPRNQSGEPTAQTQFVTDFADKLIDVADKVVFQDESLTSVMAEDQLKAYDKPYSKADIDAQAAAIILQDYLDQLS